MVLLLNALSILPAAGAQHHLSESLQLQDEKRCESVVAKAREKERRAFRVYSSSSSAVRMPKMHPNVTNSLPIHKVCADSTSFVSHFSSVEINKCPSWFSSMVRKLLDSTLPIIHWHFVSVLVLCFIYHPLWQNKFHAFLVNFELILNHINI